MSLCGPDDTHPPGSDRARFKLIIVVMTHPRTDRHIAAYIDGLLPWLPCRYAHPAEVTFAVALQGHNA